MRNAKRLFVLTCVTIIIVVTACGCTLWKTKMSDELINQIKKEATTLNMVDAVTDIQIETTINPAKTEDMAKLEAILKNIKNLTPGTAGSSLKATIVAASFLDFCSTTSLNVGEASALTMEYMLSLTTAEKEVLPEQVNSLKNACDQLRTDRAADMLDAAGVTESLCPWDNLNEEVYSTIITALSK